MLNWAIRYRPIIQEIRHCQPNWVLEVGSGPEGLQMFWHGKVVGVDLYYKRRPLHHAINANILALPFTDRSCPFVVSCDLLEHLPPTQRHQAVLQMARVAQDRLVFVFPTGDAADQLFHSLARSYRFSKVPEWLRQHLDFGLPDAKEIENWLLQVGWKATTTWFESVRMHKVLLYLEFRLGGKFISYSMMRLFGPKIIEWLPTPKCERKLRVMLNCSRIDY